MNIDILFVASGPRTHHGNKTSTISPATWDRIGAKLNSDLPTLLPSPIHNGRSYADPDTGVELLLTTHEITLLAPLGLAGVRQATVIDMLRDVVTIVERLTGLTATDNQGFMSILAPEVDQFESVPAQLRELVR